MIVLLTVHISRTAHIGRMGRTAAMDTTIIVVKTAHKRLLLCSS